MGCCQVQPIIHQLSPRKRDWSSDNKLHMGINSGGKLGLKSHLSSHAPWPKILEDPVRLPVGPRSSGRWRAKTGDIVQSLNMWHVSHACAISVQCTNIQEIYGWVDVLSPARSPCIITWHTCGSKIAWNKSNIFLHIKISFICVHHQRDHVNHIQITDRQKIKPLFLYYLHPAVYTQQEEWIHMFNEPLPETPVTSQLANTQQGIHD